LLALIWGIEALFASRKRLRTTNFLKSMLYTCLPNPSGDAHDIPYSPENDCRRCPVCALPAVPAMAQTPAKPKVALVMKSLANEFS
jgi:hypothetical protein